MSLLDNHESEILCDEKTCPILTQIQKEYLSALQIEFVSFQKLLNHLKRLSYDCCSDHVNHLGSLTIEHVRTKKYPVKRSYQRAFLKRLLDELASVDYYFEDGYLKYVDSLSHNDEDVHHKHFLIGENLITLRENNSFVSQGTTGLCTWQAGVALANWALRHKDYFVKKNIFEFGSGSGFTGLAIVHSEASPESYTFSDCHTAVLDQLKFNLNLNPIKSKTEIKVLNLSWEQVPIQEKFQPQVILAADVVYDTATLPALCQALSHLIDSEETIGFVACTVRNPETLKEFSNLLDSTNLQVNIEEYIKEDTDPFPLVSNPSVQIYTLRFKQL